MRNQAELKRTLII